MQYEGFSSLMYYIGYNRIRGWKIKSRSMVEYLLGHLRHQGLDVVLELLLRGLPERLLVVLPEKLFIDGFNL